MIFVCGMISVIIGFCIMVMFGDRYSYSHNAGDYIGAIGIYGGIFAMMYSIGVILWRLMP